MRRVAGIVISVAILSVGCGSSSSPSTAPIVFTANILPSNELGNIQGGETSGSGNATITFVTTKDGSGSLTSATANFNVTLSGFPAGTNVTLAHIHVGSSTVNGGIVVNTGVASGDVPLTNGAGGFQKLSINITDLGLAQQIINNPSGYYFNVHTTANPSGVARAQLVKQ